MPATTAALSTTATNLSYALSLFISISSQWRPAAERKRTSWFQHDLVRALRQRSKAR
jgi:hypothetical protein